MMQIIFMMYCFHKKMLNYASLTCSLNRATVVERPHIWYKDDGQLTKRVCPEMPRRMRGSSRPTATQLHLVNRPQSHLHHADPAETDRNDVPDRKVRRNHGMIKNDSLTNLQPRRISDMMASLKQLQQLNENNRNLPAPANTPRPSIVPPSNPTPAPPVPAPPPPPLSQPNGPEKSAKCCACDEAKYEVKSCKAPHIYLHARHAAPKKLMLNFCR